MRSNGLKVTLCGLTACAAIAAAAWAQEPAAPAPGNTSAAAASVYERLARGEVRASSVPSEKRGLSFAQPGLISEVPVKDGDTIKVGQVLAKQDTQVEEAALAREQFLFDSNVQARAAVAQRDLSKTKFERTKDLFEVKKAASQFEFDEAKLELEVSELKVELADEETKSKGLDIARLKKQIERMVMTSPIEGEVRKVEMGVGEVSDPQKPSMTVVTNNPLHVEANVPSTIANTLKVGQPMQVRYLEEGEWREAKIKNFDPVANAMSGETLVRLELANPEGRRSGQKMALKLPENVAAAK